MKTVPLEFFIVVEGFDMEKIATTLFNPIKNQVLHHLGAGVEESVPGQSMERHKEPDKKSIRTLLVEMKHVSRSYNYYCYSGNMLDVMKGPSGSSRLLALQKNI